MWATKFTDVLLPLALPHMIITVLVSKYVTFIFKTLHYNTFSVTKFTDMLVPLALTYMNTKVLATVLDIYTVIFHDLLSHTHATALLIYCYLLLFNQ